MASVVGVRQKGTVYNIVHLHPQAPQFLRKSYYHLYVRREIKEGRFPLDWHRQLRDSKVQIFFKKSAEPFSSQSLAPFP